MTVKERIAALRARMKETEIDAYLIPTDDFHGSEYVGEYFKCRKYITGFTGSAGTAVIMQDMAGLWTDGRYFIQAIQNRDYPLIMGTTIFLATFIIIMNLVVDLCYKLVDPRINLAKGGN